MKNSNLGWRDSLAIILIGGSTFKKSGCGNQLARYHRRSSKESIIDLGTEERVMLTVTILYFYIP